jgi:GT2 family glycosyltransferase
MTSSPPRISVCIANYNGEHLLADCIESVLAQKVDASVEILVHDDASTDSSVSLLRNRYPQVYVIESSANVGFCVSNNRMVEQSHGDYVLLLNNDAMLLPGALSTLLAAAKRSEPCVLGLTQYDWASGVLVDRGCLLDPFYNPVPIVESGREEVAYVIGACLWVPVTLWRQLGGLPAWMESIGEDMYFCCIARLAGISVRVPEGSGYRHRQGTSFGGNRLKAGRMRTTARRRYLSELNKTAVLFVCTPSVWVWPLLTVHLGMLVLEGVALCIMQRKVRPWSEIYGPALAGTMFRLGRLAILRGEVQSIRRCGVRQYFSVFVPFLRKLQMFVRHGLPTIT